MVMTFTERLFTIKILINACYCIVFPDEITGESFASLGYQFRVGRATVHKIVKETSHAILWETVQPQYLPVPNEH